MSLNKVLVTGGTSFVGGRIIYQLLKQGYEVKTTLRDLNKTNEIIEIMKRNGVDPDDKLSFSQCNLMSDENWNEAMNDCDYVLSVASPVFF